MSKPIRKRTVRPAKELSPAGRKSVMNPLETFLESFTGYFYLRMYLEANHELEKLPTKIKTHPRVLEARLILLMAMNKWEIGALLGNSLSKFWPSVHEFYFKTAYCLHELKRTPEAKETLLSAPASIRNTALYSLRV